MTLKIIVKGIVQNVSYRDTTKRKADELGIRGTIENLDNGDVYIIAQGKKDMLDAFTEWCKTGPSKAQVSDIEVNTVVDSDFLKNFIIKRW